MDIQRLLLVFNPKSGKEEFVRNLYEVVDLFTKSGFEVTLRPTQGPRDAYQYVLEEGPRFDRVVCSGGDGTISETLDALMRCKNPPLFGYIPSGTTNDFASTVGIPGDALLAARVAAQGEPRSIDVGRFGDKYYSYVAAFGLFTDVSYATPQVMKNVLGHAAYMMEGVRRLTAIHSYLCRVEIGEEVIQGDFLFGMVTNATSIAGFKIPMGEAALLDDGLFEVALVRRPQSVAETQEIVAVLLGAKSHCDGIVFRRAPTIRVVSEEALQWTVDGEYGGETTDVTIQNYPRALRILVPPDA